jgi:hypothetical protein
MVKRLLDGSVKVGLVGLALLASPLWADDKSNEAWQRMSRLQCLIEYFYMETGVYPLDLSEMDQIFRSRAPRAPKPVAIPVDPATNQPFKYQLEQGGRKYSLTVPDPARYGGSKMVLTSVDWGYLSDLADLKRFEEIVRSMNNLMKGIATQCEMYAKDHGGQYPAQLDDLLPKYLQRFPNDPLTGKNMAYKKQLDGYLIICPNPEKYGLKTFQYSSSQGIQTERLPRKEGKPAEAPKAGETPKPNP